MTMVTCLFWGSTYILINVSILSYFMALAYFFQARRKHFGYIFASIDDIKAKRLPQNDLQLKKLLLKALLLHIETKRYSFSPNPELQHNFVSSLLEECSF